jgi:hypothetical protein
MLPFDITPVIIVSIVFVSIVAVVVTPIAFHFQRQKEIQKTLRLAIEKGQQLEPETLEKLMGAVGRTAERRPDADLRGGIMTLFVGVAIAAFGAIHNGVFANGTWEGFGDSSLLAIGALVSLIGLGRIVVHYATRRRPQPEQGPDA